MNSNNSNIPILGKKILNLIVLFLVLFSSVTFVPKRAHAGVRKIWRGAQHAMHMAVDKEYRENSIVKTAMSAGLTFFTGIPSNLLLGRNPDELSNCALLVRDLSENGELVGGNCGGGGPIPCTIEWLDEMGASPEDYQLAEEAAEIVATYTDGECNLNDTPFSVADATTGRGGGSLLSMVVRMEKSVHREEIPVNMALFFKDYARRIPVVQNTAFAQGTSNYLGSQFVFGVWQVVRNIALGAMSLILLIIGIMIMTRKKINPQAVVTVQNALPRVAISIVLIFFSYPIGALLIKLFLPLMVTASSIIWEIMSAQWEAVVPGAVAAPAGTSFAITSVVGWAILAVTGLLTWQTMGTAMLFGLIAVLFTLVIILFIAFIKIMIIYVKLLTFIILSPIYFAVGAIPGKETAIMDWFKEMISNVLAAAAMIFVIGLSLSVPFFVLAGASGGSTQEFISSTLTVTFTPVMMIFLAITAIKMPKKIDGWIKGDKKRR